jgi:hypothetical protein
MDTPGRVQVVVRARPLLLSECTRGETSIISCLDSKNITAKLLNHHRAFSYDLVLAQEHQASVFSRTNVASFVEAALEGVNATVMAYGATASGKTYTMSGLSQSTCGEDSALEDHADSGAHEGLILKSARYLYQWMATLANETCGGNQYSVVASYCEVYNEQVFDLLNLTGRPLPVRHQSVSDEFYVPGLLEVHCGTLDDVNAVLKEGHRNRRRASHDLNQDSSRSHSVLTLYVRCDLDALPGGRDAGAVINSAAGDSNARPPQPPAALSPTRVRTVSKRGKLVFVDLAGSERLKRSKSNDPEETGAINKSLFTLAKVISILADNSKELVSDQQQLAPLLHASIQRSQGAHSVHIPYRDSVLTKLLSDTLGGNALALFIACVSPADARGEETLATLQYAMRARSICNRPKVRIDGANTQQVELEILRDEVVRLRRSADRVTELEGEVAFLKAQVDQARNQGFVYDPSGTHEGRFVANSDLYHSPGSNIISTSPLGRRSGTFFSRNHGKAKLSRDGGGMVGRPPPGAAGRGLREATEKLKRSVEHAKRLESALAASKKESMDLRTQLALAQIA